MEYSVDKCKTLLAEFGSPLYHFNQAEFIENYHSLKDTFCAIYPNYKIAYSYKTNYAPFICRTVKNLGGYAEVVSGMEYQLAQRLGYGADKIIFNGPDKGKAGANAFLAGAMVNADNLTELAAYCAMALDRPEESFHLGIRVNLDLGKSFCSRFGLDEKELDKAFAMVSGVSNLTINGLHCHISRCRGLKAWHDRASYMLDIADRYFENPPAYIDLGSGMFGDMAPEFACQFSDVSSYRDYAEAVAGQFAAHYGHLPASMQPILFTEPGTTLVNKYVDVLSTVTGINNIRGKSSAILDCSEHVLGEVCTLKNLPVNIIPISAERKEYENIDFAGYTCLEQDVMYCGYTGMLGVGDCVVFGNTGGYSNVLKPPFIRPNCAMVAQCNDGSYRLIKRKETFEDIFCTYNFE